jgi:hypothetical protein
MTRRKAILASLLTPFALKAVIAGSAAKPHWIENPEFDKATHSISFCMLSPTYTFKPSEFAGKWQFVGAEILSP